MSNLKTIARSKTRTRPSNHSVQGQSFAEHNKVAEEAKRRLEMTSHLALRHVSCEFHEGMLVLRGTVPSFYLKQVAQEAVLKMEGVDALVNALEVGD